MTTTYTTTHSALLPGLLTALFLVACAAGAQAPDRDMWRLPAPDAEVARSLDRSLQEAPPSETTREAPRATRPDALLSSLPEGASAIFLLDVDALLASTLSGHLSTGHVLVDADNVRMWVLDAISAWLPELGDLPHEAVPSSVAVAVYGDASETSQPVVVLEGIHPTLLEAWLPGLVDDGYVITGSGTRTVVAPGYLAARLPARGGTALEARELGPWNALPEHAFLAVHANGLDRLPLPVRMIAIQLLGGRLDAMSLGVALDGTTTAVFTGDDSLDPHGFALRSLAILRDHLWDDLPLDPSDEIRTMVDLATGAMAAWFEVDVREGSQIVTLPAIRCGAFWRQLIPVTAVAVGAGLAFQVGADLTAEPSRPHLDVPLAPACTPLGGSSPPLSAAFFDGSWGGAGALAAAGWISVDDLLRDRLPSLGVLPFALEESALREMALADELATASERWILGPVLGIGRHLAPDVAFAFWIPEAMTSRFGVPSMWLQELEEDVRFERTLGAGYVFREPWAADWHHRPDAAEPTLRRLLLDTVPASLHGIATSLEDDAAAPVHPTDWVLAFHRRHGWYAAYDYRAGSLEGNLRAGDENTEAARANARDMFGPLGPAIEATFIDVFDHVGESYRARRSGWGERILVRLTAEESAIMSSVFPALFLTTLFGLSETSPDTWIQDRFWDEADGYPEVPMPETTPPPTW